MMLGQYDGLVWHKVCNSMKCLIEIEDTDNGVKYGIWRRFTRLSGEVGASTC